MQDFVNGEAAPFPKSGAQRVGEPGVSPQEIFQISWVAIAVEKLTRHRRRKTETRRLME